MLCSFCGKENEAKNKFCVQCGELLSEKSRPQKVRATQTTEKIKLPGSKKVFIPVILVLIILLVPSFAITKTILNRREHSRQNRIVMPPPEVPYCPSPSLETNIPESNSSMSMREFTDKNNTQNAFSNDISGEWNGYIEIQREPYRTHLFVQQTGMNLSGKVIYQNVEESLEGAIKTNGQIFLKGVSYRRLSGTGGFNLDTFQGRLSEDGLSIAGNSVDTSGFNASWSLTKGPGRLSDVDSRNKAETNKEVSIINTVGKWAETQKSLPDAVNPKMDSKQTGKTIPTTFSERNSRSGYSRPSVSEGTNTGRKHISSEKHYNNIKRNSIRKSRRD